MLFSWLHDFAFPPAVHEGPSFSTSSPTLVISRVFSIVVILMDMRWTWPIFLSLFCVISLLNGLNSSISPIRFLASIGHTFLFFRSFLPLLSFLLTFRLVEYFMPNFRWMECLINSEFAWPWAYLTFTVAPCGGYLFPFYPLENWRFHR